MQVSISDGIEFFEPVTLKSIQELADIAVTKNFSPAVFTDGKRRLANFESCGCIALDIDNDPKVKNTTLMTIEEAKVAFAEYVHMIVPSRNHQKDKKGLVADRFRVILFLETTITDVETFYSTWFWCKAKWPAIDPACKNADRFFYRHQSVHSIQAKGKLLTPVAPKPKEPKKEVDLSSLLLPGERGNLAKSTHSFLTDGDIGECGGRNHATFKASKDFQQNRYTLEETLETIISALSDNGTIASDFPAEEVSAAIHSAFSTDPKHEPRVEPQAFNFMSVDALYKLNVKREWLVDRLIARRSVTLVGGPPKSGKSTLMRGAAHAIARGGEFLGHKCTQGSVLYFALDEHLDVIKEDFQRIGITGDDPIHVHVGGAKLANALDHFVELIKKQKPDLAVIDTVFKLAPVKNANDYSEVNPVMVKLSEAAESGTAVVIIHHTNKGNLDRSPFDSILGSTAIRGGTDANIIVEVDRKRRLFSSEGRGGMAWYTRRPLEFDYGKHLYTMPPEAEDEY